MELQKCRFESNTVFIFSCSVSGFCSVLRNRLLRSYQPQYSVIIIIVSGSLNPNECELKRPESKCVTEQICFLVCSSGME